VSFPAELLLLAWVLLSILSTGLAIVHRFLKMRGFDLIVYGIGAGVILHGLFGLWIALVERYHRQICGLLGCVAIAGIVYLWKQKVIVDLVRDLSRPIKIFLGIWIAFVISCIAITHLDVNWPPALPGMQFVFKSHTENVKIQVLTDGPTDNSIPYLVQEFLLRRIPFEKERPLLFPGTEVAQRTILMSLAGLPFRAVIDPPPRYREPLPKAAYDGHQLPNVETLYTDSGFRQFLTIAIALNSLLLLGIGLFCANLGMTAWLPIAALLFATSPYFVAQMIYTWPKALAAFFVVLAWDAFRRSRDAPLVAVCSALAYHCHPYALTYLGGMGLCCLLGRDRTINWRNAAWFPVVAGLFLLPWIIWTHHFQIPSMFGFHFYGDGVHTIFPNRIWVRVFNLFGVLTPTFPLVYPFDALRVARTFLVNLPGAAGLILFIPGLIRLFRLDNRVLFYAGICLPAAFVIFVFGRPDIATQHGIQPIAAAVLFLGVAQMRERLKPGVFWALIAVQLLLNLSLIVAIGSSVGAHFV
jgi:hypothetical protein